MPPLTVGELKAKLANVPDDYVVQISNHYEAIYNVDEMWRDHKNKAYMLSLGEQVK